MFPSTTLVTLNFPLLNLVFMSIVGMKYFKGNCRQKTLFLRNSHQQRMRTKGLASEKKSNDFQLCKVFYLDILWMTSFIMVLASIATVSGENFYQQFHFLFCFEWTKIRGFLINQNRYARFFLQKTFSTHLLWKQSFPLACSSVKLFPMAFPSFESFCMAIPSTNLFLKKLPNIDRTFCCHSLAFKVDFFGFPVNKIEFHTLIFPWLYLQWNLFIWSSLRQIFFSSNSQRWIISFLGDFASIKIDFFGFATEQNELHELPMNVVSFK